MPTSSYKDRLERGRLLIAHLQEKAIASATRISELEETVERGQRVAAEGRDLCLVLSAEATAHKKNADERQIIIERQAEEIKRLKEVERLRERDNEAILIVYREFSNEVRQMTVRDVLSHVLALREWVYGFGDIIRSYHAVVEGYMVASLGFPESYEWACLIPDEEITAETLDDGVERIREISERVRVQTLQPLRETIRTDTMAIDRLLDTIERSTTL